MTTAWSATSLGLIFHVCSVAFFVLGVAALSNMRAGAGLAAHLVWLAAFGILHGLQYVFDEARLHNPAIWLAVLSTALMIGSLAALMEFGRRIWNEQPGRRRVAATPLYGAVALGIVALLFAAPTTTAALELGSSYLLGAPGAALAGFALLHHARSTARAHDTADIIFWLRVAAFALLAYAALTLLLTPGLGRTLEDARISTTAALITTLGLSVHLALALCAVVLAMGFVVANRHSNEITTETLQRVTDNLNGFVYRCRNDHNWTVTFMSEGGETLTGYPTADFLLGKRHFAEQIHPDDQDYVWHEVQTALAARDDFNMQYRMIDRAGTVRWCYEEGRGVFDSQGQLRYLEGLVRNDEERHKAQLALQQERDFAKSLLDTAPAIILLMDPQGMIRHVNPCFEQLTGYRLDEIVGKEWFTTFLPARDQARIRELFASTFNDQPVRGNINPIITRDGEERAIEWYAMTLRDADGQMTGLLSIGMDVTERQQLENRLRELNQSLEQRVVERTRELGAQLLRNETILATAIDGFFAVDVSGRIRQTNHAFCEMLGYQESELLSMSIPDIESAETPEETAAHIQTILARGHDRFDTVHRRKDGSSIEVEISVSLVSLEAQQMFYAFVRDIGSRKAAEAALRKARDEAERANAAKNEFLSRMSHELRTPLNAILGFTQVLQLPGEQTLNESQAESVREIHLAGQHLLGLVDEVLHLARLETGPLEVKLEPVALIPLIQQGLARIQPEAGARGIGTSLQPHEPCWVLADEPQLKKVLLSLLSNAVKYNRSGGSIEVAVEAAYETHLRVSVRDTGGGLSAEQCKRIFHPFERLETAYDGIAGAGIGLAVAKHLIEGMRGTIGVHSVPDEGSSFWFELPRCSTIGHESIEPSVARQGTHTVLYVEDNPANLRLVQRILSKRPDIELLSAKNAEEGLILAGREHPDLILVDLNLPGMDGFELLQCLRNDPSMRSTPVIAVTANAMKHDIERGKTAGFQDYLVKPINVRDFLSTIDPYVTVAKDAS